VSWEGLPPSSTFEKARRREAYRKFARVVRRTDTEELLPLEEVQRRLRAFEQTYEGVRPIPIANIVGTSERTRDFDKNFLPRSPRVRDRWKDVERAFPEGIFPPIVVYELEGTYFVIDGHHRVAIAKQRGAEYLDAEVTRLRARYKMPEGADIGRIIHTEQEQWFMEESGLERARPEARIHFSRPTGYAELLELIRTHGYYVMIDRDEILPIPEIAADWYDWVYLPTIEAIREERLTDVFPDATESDLFLWVWQRRRSLFPELGGMTLEEAVRHARASETKRFRHRARDTMTKLIRPTQLDENNTE
jgi:hypothetical protein